LDKNHSYACEVRRAESDEILFGSAAGKGSKVHEKTQATGIVFTKDRTPFPRSITNLCPKWFTMAYGQSTGAETWWHTGSERGVSSGRVARRSIPWWLESVSLDTIAIELSGDG